MTVAEVTTVISQAATRSAAISPSSVIAVVDREGYVLGVWSVNGVTAGAMFTTNMANAIAKAGTAAFLSSDNHAFTSRTAAAIVQQNFPVGIRERPPGPLVGVNFSQLPFSDVNRYKDPATFIIALGANGTNGAAVPIPASGGLAGTAGGVPLYRNGALIGGVGVAGDGDGFLDIRPETVLAPDVDEDVALAGQIGFAPAPAIHGSHVFIDGIRVPYVTSSTSLGAVIPLGGIGSVSAAFPIVASPFTVNGVSYPTATMGGLTGELRQPIIADPATNGLPAGMGLTAAEVTAILTAAANRVRTTRAGIRLPRGRQMQAFISVVNNPAMDGIAPVVLGTFGTSPDATRFSWDVAVQKARTCVFFSSNTRAFSTRTVGFMSQLFYPPGIAKTQPGIFRGIQEMVSIITPGGSISFTSPLNLATITTRTTPNPNLPNGLTIFPGGVPLYRDGVLIGAIGVSGDGVDQDDIAAASGAALFPAPEAIRANRMIYRGARLPYVKFPRNPAL